jgi:hypothetical protein
MIDIGKSIISRIVADNFTKNRYLLANFFFSLDDDKRDRAIRFFTIFASQLVNVSPDLKGYICYVITEHNDIAKKFLRE